MTSGATTPRMSAAKFAPGVHSDMPKPRLFGANQREMIFGRIAIRRPAQPMPQMDHVTIAAARLVPPNRPKRIVPIDDRPHASVIAQRVPILSPNMPHTSDRPA